MDPALAGVAAAVVTGAGAEIVRRLLPSHKDRHNAAGLLWQELHDELASLRNENRDLRQELDDERKRNRAFEVQMELEVRNLRKALRACEDLANAD